MFCNRVAPYSNFQCAWRKGECNEVHVNFIGISRFSEELNALNALKINFECL